MSSSARFAGRLLSVVSVVVCAVLPLRSQSQGVAGPVVLPRVDVIATTPLPGLDVPITDVPANVQTIGRRELDRAGPIDPARVLFREAVGVSLDNAQGNPWQQDLLYRGFIVSPLLGTPQGVSVYQDGVRVNEAFGDVVNWDLLPTGATASMQILPGSNPVFGLNTLGGSILVQTRRGDRFPGVELEASAGSFGSRQASVTAGGTHGMFDGFIAANAAGDHGWAEHNASRVRQLFAQLGARSAGTDAAIALTAADNRLSGIQTLPMAFLDRPKEAYTWPDENRNRLALVTARLAHHLDDNITLSGHLYGRRSTNENVSSNVNDEFDDADDPEAFNDRSNIEQTSWGAAVQLALERTISGIRHRVAFGAMMDTGRVEFNQDTQPATFTADRGTVASGPFESETAVTTRNRYIGAYVSDTIALANAWTLTLAGRYNHARVEVADRSGHDPELDGQHRFARFSPALGLNWNPSPDLGAWVAANEGMRAPTPVELTCADPEAPCKLPNNFLADPPLAKVVARTAEVGARGHWDSGGSWSAAAFVTKLDNDIQFVAAQSGALNAGFFRNVGTTRRAGIELAASTKLDAWSLAVRYAWTQATFRAPFQSTSPANSSASESGTIDVRKGDRIPGIPAHLAKLIAEYAFGDRGAVTFTLATVSSRHARGDENNADAGGRIPGYALANLDLQYRFADCWMLVMHIENLFDRRCQTAGVLGQNFFTGPSRTFGPAVGAAPDATQFRAPGAPIGAWLGVHYAFDLPEQRR